MLSNLRIYPDNKRNIALNSKVPSFCFYLLHYLQDFRPDSFSGSIKNHENSCSDQKKLKIIILFSAEFQFYMFDFFIKNVETIFFHCHVFWFYVPLNRGVQLKTYLADVWIFGFTTNPYGSSISITREKEEEVFLGFSG